MGRKTARTALSNTYNTRKNQIKMIYIKYWVGIFSKVQSEKFIFYEYNYDQTS